MRRVRSIEKMTIGELSMHPVRASGMCDDLRPCMQQADGKHGARAHCPRRKNSGSCAVGSVGECGGNPPGLTSNLEVRGREADADAASITPVADEALEVVN